MGGAPRQPRVDVDHYDGYLAIGQSGSRVLQANIEALQNQWTPHQMNQMKHDVSRTCSAAKREFGMTASSLLAVIQIPSHRLESGFRRRYNTAKSSHPIATKPRNVQFLQAFPTVEALVKAVQDVGSPHHKLALRTVSSNSSQSWGRPVTWYLDDDDPSSRVTWLCWNRLRDHWRQATVSNLHAAQEDLDQAAHGSDASEADPATLLSAASRLFVDTVVYADDWRLYNTVCPGDQRPQVTDGKGGYLGMIRFHLSPANISWLPVSPATGPASIAAETPWGDANADVRGAARMYQVESDTVDGSERDNGGGDTRAPAIPFEDVSHIDGYLAIARSGSLSLKQNIEFAHPKWDDGSLDHSHDRTSLMARSLLGATSLIATMRRPSDRLESGFRRRLDAVKAQHKIGHVPRNLQLLDTFPTVERLVAALHDSSSSNHETALQLVSKHSGQGWGRPVSSYLDTDDPKFRITWLCLDKLQDHWEAATGRPFLSSAVVTDGHAVNSDSSNPMSHAGTHQSGQHPEAVLSERSRSYINNEVYADDMRLFKALCPWDSAAGKAGGPLPFVTDGKGTLLGPTHFAANFTAPQRLLGWDYPPRNPFEGNLAASIRKH